jgi:hypothetical protein
MRKYLLIYVAGFFNSRKTPDFKQGRGSTRFWFSLKFDFMTHKSTIWYADHF